MIKSSYKVIGVMSGTSLDGIDLALIQFDFSSNYTFKILKYETVAYNSFWNDTLKSLVSLSFTSLKELDNEYTKYLSNVINTFIVKHNINDIDAICSHGHTALHQPEKKLTYQIGNLPQISSLLKQTVVCDFRTQDVELRGQGAPLVPIGDMLLFSEYDYCLNLGGFANISTEIKGERIAYDICPVNIVLNHYVSKLGHDYDDKGKIASTGILNIELLDALNMLNFYQQTYPKSLGLEWVNKNIMPLIDGFKLGVSDILRTFVEHIAVQISNEVNTKENASVLITGGGVYNLFLIERIQEKTKNKICIPNQDLIEYKEALIFGLLGVLKLRGEDNCLSSVTGASRNHSSGRIYKFNI